MQKTTILKILTAILLVVASGISLFFLTDYASEKQRDVQRLSDVAVMRLALESYFFYKQSYPLALNAVVLGVNEARVLCDTVAGIQADTESCDRVFTASIAPDPLSRNDFVYTYTSDSHDYSLGFSLERNDSGLVAGRHVATASGIK